MLYINHTIIYTIISLKLIMSEQNNIISLAIGCNKTRPSILFIGNSYDIVTNSIINTYDINLKSYTFYTNIDDDDEYMCPFLGEIEYDKGTQYCVPKQDIEKCANMFYPASSCSNTCFCNIYVLQLQKNSDFVIDIAKIMKSIYIC